MKFCSSGCSQRAMWRITHPVKTGPSRPPSSFWYWGWTHPTPAASGLGQKYCDKQKFKKILYCSDSFVSEDRQLCGIKPLRQTGQGKEKKQRTLQPLAVPAALTLSCSSLCNLCHSEQVKQGEIYAMLTLSLCFCTFKRGTRLLCKSSQAVRSVCNRAVSRWKVLVKGEIILFFPVDIWSLWYN